MVDFNYFKSKISIIQVAEDLGYKQDLSKGRISPVLKLGDNVIIVKNPCSANEYFFGNSGNKGDLISFVKQNISSFPQFPNANIYVRINMILRHYANIPYLEGEKFKKAKTAFDLEDYEVKECTEVDVAYFVKERGLSEDTIKTFLPFIKRVKNVKRKSRFFNVAFPYSVPGSSRITNFEFRNYDFKGMAEGGDKTNSVWIACFEKSPELVEDLYFFESGIDALSFYELNKQDLDLGKIALVSLGGNLMPEQIIRSIACFKNAKVHTAFDADAAGAVYDVKVSCILENRAVAVVTAEDYVKISFENTAFVFKKETFSLEEFLKETSLLVIKKERKPAIVHKPGYGKDFNDELKLRGTLLQYSSEYSNKNASLL